MISIQVFISKFFSILIWKKYFRNTNSQSKLCDRGQAKLDFMVLKQSSLQNYILHGSKAIFFLSPLFHYWCLQKGKGPDNHKACKSSSLFTCVGWGQEIVRLTYLQYFFSFIIRKNRPVCTIHTEADEPQVFYLTLLFAFTLPELCPAPAVPSPASFGSTV